ncbi:MAG: hypothetical protein BGO69_13850 [Bacteroidetes bacterium 46-16]|nr:MAG: hypothetical protein BGO69_13850 [Bacteroidetes bacterium 46-16]
MPSFKISNDRSILEHSFSNEERSKALGGIYEDLIYNKNDFAYSIMPLIKNNTRFITHDMMLEQNYLSKMIEESVKEFLAALWYVKDNSVSAHDMVSDLDEITSIHLSTNYVTHTTSDGSMSDIHFSKTELQKAKKLLNSWAQLCPNLNKIASFEEFKERIGFENGLTMSSLRGFDYNKLNRLERASVLLDLARSNSYLPLKISFFMPVFECLFVAQSGSEVQQKVCERVAFYVAKNKKQREKVFNDLKQCYSVRSRFLHGDKLDAKKHDVDNLIRLSKAIDDIARTIFVRIIERDHSKFVGNKEFDEYLSRLIFQ